MPFVKKNDATTPQPPLGTQKIFIGRTHELRFFTEDILKAQDPGYNIISLHGNGGVGKSTLVSRLRTEVTISPYKSYCLTALVDELQSGPEDMMERFAEQLHIGGAFKNALHHYKDVLRKEQEEQETMQDAVLQHASDIAGATVEGVPFVGPLLREGAKIAVGRAVNRFRAGQAQQRAIEHFEDPIASLTVAFVAGLNRLAEARVNVPEQGVRREHRIILIFDTFEQLAPAVAPWLLDYFLPLNINSNIVLLTAGRVPLERSLPDDPKRWLPYLDQHVIYSMNLNSFTEQETRAFLAQRGITDAGQIQRIWQLSRGLPLYLSLLTTGTQRDVDPTADVVANFLRWLPEHEELKRRLILDAALFSRPFNQDDLAAFSYIAESQRLSLYRWLIKQPFVHPSTMDGRYSYHELAEELFSRHLYRSSPGTSYATRRALADYYRNSLDELQAQGGREVYQDDEWLNIAIALAQQYFLLPDEQSHLKAIELVLDIYYRTRQEEELTRILREVAEDQHFQQSNANARHLAQVTLNYLEAEPMTTEFLTASDRLLHEVAASTTFSSSLLARLYGTRGVTYRTFDDYQLALADFDRAIALNPDYAWAYGNRGITYRVQRNYLEALTDFNTALKLDETMDWIYSARGEVYRHLRNYPQALADFDRALELDPDYAQAYAGRGRVFSRLGRFTDALNDLNQAIVLDGEQDWFFAQRGEVLRNLSHHDKAIVDFNQAIALNPTYFWAYASRGLAYFFQGDFEQAIASYNQAIELNPSYDWAYAERGRTYHHRKEYERAIADFDRAIALAPRYAWTYSHRGLSYAALKEYQKAIQNFNIAIGMAPSYGRAYGRRGSAYLAMGQPGQAQSDFARNYELSPDDLWAGWMNEWVRMCREGRDPDLARRLDEIAAKNPTNYTALVCSAVALWLRNREAGNSEQALARLEEASTTRPDWWDAYFWKGLISCSQSLTEGIASLQSALDNGIPQTLLAPLRWLATEQPEWYRLHLAPFDELYGANGTA